MADGHVEVHQRASIVEQHPGGTAEIQRVIIARRLGIGRAAAEEPGQVPIRATVWWIAMDLSLTEQQKMLQATARELVVRDYSRETLVAIDAGRESSGPHWAGLVSTGLLGVLVPEEYGGAGGSLADAAVAYEELGQGPVPGPHFSSGVLAALAVLEGRD